jgi:hypothetical protein
MRRYGEGAPRNLVELYARMAEARYLVALSSTWLSAGQARQCCSIAAAPREQRLHSRAGATGIGIDLLRWTLWLGHRGGGDAWRAGLRALAQADAAAALPDVLHRRCAAVVLPRTLREYSRAMPRTLRCETNEQPG